MQGNPIKSHMKDVIAKPARRDRNKKKIGATLRISGKAWLKTFTDTAEV
jgi:hypothetical protein